MRCRGIFCTFWYFSLFFLTLFRIYTIFLDFSHFCCIFGLYIPLTPPKDSDAFPQQAPTCPPIPAGFGLSGLSAPQPRSPKTPCCTVRQTLIGTPRHLESSSDAYTRSSSSIPHSHSFPHAYTRACIINITIVIPDRFCHGLFLVKVALYTISPRISAVRTHSRSSTSSKHRYPPVHPSPCVTLE